MLRVAVGDLRKASNASGEERHQNMGHTSIREGDSKGQEAETTRSCREVLSLTDAVGRSARARPPWLGRRVRGLRAVMPHWQNHTLLRVWLVVAPL